MWGVFFDWRLIDRIQKITIGSVISGFWMMYKGGRARDLDRILRNTNGQVGYPMPFLSCAKNILRNPNLQLIFPEPGDIVRMLFELKCEYLEIADQLQSGQRFGFGYYSETRHLVSLSIHVQKTGAGDPPFDRLRVLSLNYSPQRIEGDVLLGLAEPGEAVVRGNDGSAISFQSIINTAVERNMPLMMASGVRSSGNPTVTIQGLDTGGQSAYGGQALTNLPNYAENVLKGCADQAIHAVGEEARLNLNLLMYEFRVDNVARGQMTVREALARGVSVQAEDNDITQADNLAIPGVDAILRVIREVLQ